MVAVEVGLPPEQVWAMAPRDLATVVDVLTERAKGKKRRRR